MFNDEKLTKNQPNIPYLGPRNNVTIERQWNEVITREIAY